MVHHFAPDSRQTGNYTWSQLAVDIETYMTTPAEHWRQLLVTKQRSFYDKFAVLVQRLDPTDTYASTQAVGKPTLRKFPCDPTF